MSKDEKKTEDPPMNEVLCIRPGDTSTVFAVCSEFSDVGDRDQNRHRKWYREFRFISFIPGTYPITVDAKYWDQKHGEEKNFSGDEYYTAVASADAEYAAPRWIILLGAIVGGFLFTSLSLIRAEEGALRGDSAGLLNIAKTLGKAKTTFLAVFGSILLSVIITILLSRIEEAQSLIKVNVSDFWGGIAVGFLANYGGWPLLDKMVPGAGKNESKKQNPETSSP